MDNILGTYIGSKQSVAHGTVQIPKLLTDLHPIAKHSSSYASSSAVGAQSTNIPGASSRDLAVSGFRVSLTPVQPHQEWQSQPLNDNGQKYSAILPKYTLHFHRRSHGPILSSRCQCHSRIASLGLFRGNPLDLDTHHIDFFPISHLACHSSRVQAQASQYHPSILDFLNLRHRCFEPAAQNPP
ncbi:hypothetical protein BGZ61DRAFT_221550 [Ilyonectria robusta]|uniref:uncharacterized protein n=1 Tax=Ilyonectria robusta TaxID=1079257 RepID=UPI001E8E165F|nr:uncharacterized protein BGZ61DRAFT_221550 [Ilyonectria robusta]KAH8706487.1 hypothetical protein BGZ61DRAFT_221550 [Ilyonectria robusta]